MQQQPQLYSAQFAATPASLELGSARLRVPAEQQAEPAQVSFTVEVKQRAPKTLERSSDAAVPLALLTKWLRDPHGAVGFKAEAHAAERDPKPPVRQKPRPPRRRTDDHLQSVEEPSAESKNLQAIRLEDSKAWQMLHGTEVRFSSAESLQEMCRTDGHRALVHARYALS